MGPRSLLLLALALALTRAQNLSPSLFPTGSLGRLPLATCLPSAYPLPPEPSSITLRRGSPPAVCWDPTPSNACVDGYNVTVSDAATGRPLLSNPRAPGPCLPLPSTAAAAAPSAPLLVTVSAVSRRVPSAPASSARLDPSTGPWYLPPSERPTRLRPLPGGRHCLPVAGNFSYPLCRDAQLGLCMPYTCAEHPAVRGTCGTTWLRNENRDLGVLTHYCADTCPCPGGVPSLPAATAATPTAPQQRAAAVPASGGSSGGGFNILNNNQFASGIASFFGRVTRQDGPADAEPRRRRALLQTQTQTAVSRGPGGSCCAYYY
jgi:hypothetical protein